MWAEVLVRRGYENVGTDGRTVQAPVGSEMHARARGTGRLGQVLGGRRSAGLLALHDPDNVDLRSLTGTGGASLLALIPELRDRSLAPGSAAAESEGARFQLFDAVAWLLRDVASAHPVVIVLDDLHAADTPSLLLLQFLAGQLADVAVMLAGLYRDDDPGADGTLSACLASLARERATRRMKLSG